MCISVHLVHVGREPVVTFVHSQCFRHTSGFGVEEEGCLEGDPSPAGGDILILWESINWTSTSFLCCCPHTATFKDEQTLEISGYLLQRDSLKSRDLVCPADLIF